MIETLKIVLIYGFVLLCLVGVGALLVVGQNTAAFWSSSGSDNSKEDGSPTSGDKDSSSPSCGPSGCSTEIDENDRDDDDDNWNGTEVYYSDTGYDIPVVDSNSSLKGEFVETTTIGGTTYNIYEGEVSGGGTGYKYVAVPVTNDDDDNSNSSTPSCTSQPYVIVYDVNVVARDGKVVPNTQLKTNVPYRIQTIVENDSCLATNDVMRYNTGVSGATFVNYTGYSGDRSANTFYRNDDPEGRHGTFPVSTIVDMAASGVANITSRVNTVGPLGRDASRSTGLSYSQVVSPSQVTSTRTPIPQKSRTQLATDEAGFTVSGNRATVYSAEFTLTTTGAGTIRAEADPNLGLSGGWILPRNSHARTENINVQTANLTLGSFLITDTGFGGANANSPRDYEYGNQIGIYWNGSNIDFPNCTGRMTRTNGDPLNDFTGKKDVAGYSSSRLALLPSGTNQDRVDLNITEPAPNQAHAYTMTCPVIGGGSISRTLRIEMGGIPVSTLVTPGITNIYAYPGEAVPSIPFTVYNPGPAGVTNFRYELDVNNRAYRYAGVNPANLGPRVTRTYTAASSTYKAPNTLGTYPMALRVYLPGYAADNFASDVATLHVVPPRYSVRVPDITVAAGAPVPEVPFTITNIDNNPTTDDDIDGYRFEADMGTTNYNDVDRWNITIPKDGAVDDVARNSSYRAPTSVGTRTDFVEVCVFVRGIVSAVCGRGDLIVVDSASLFPLTPSVANVNLTLGQTLSSIPFSVRNTSSSNYPGFRYTTTIDNRTFTANTTNNTSVGANSSLALTSAGSYQPTTVGTETIEICLTPITGTGQSCDTATLIVQDVSSNPECSDNRDNDGDDTADHAGADGLPRDPGCENANDNDETDGPVTNDDDGDGVPDPDYILSFAVTPSIVRYNTKALLTYEINSPEALTCTITGPVDGPETFTVAANTPAAGDEETRNLTGTQTFRLECTGPSGTDTATAQVEVVPETQEI